MKFLGSLLAALLSQGQARRNAKVPVRYVLLLLGIIITAFATSFHLTMHDAKGEEHSRVTGFYWTLTVMTTPGLGDITFHSDIGRLFRIAGLLTGVVLLLIVPPFVFIRFFYAPWL